MKILIFSYAFAPSVGGIEASSEMLATEFSAAGHDVRVVSNTGEESEREFPFGIVRRPGARTLWKLFRSADLIFQNNISLRFLWPAIFVRRPIFVTTQTWLGGGMKVSTWPSRIKYLVLKCTNNIAISGAIAQTIPRAVANLGNPYDAETFRILPEIPKNPSLLFVGRIVSDKGLDILLLALRNLAQQGLFPKLTVAGDGPDRALNEDALVRLGLEAQVTFTGTVRGEELARLMNAHAILVVPSRWAEPFGIVALEGIACGCGIVGSAEGGLPEAIGPCGVTFPNGDVKALAGALHSALTEPQMLHDWSENAEAHLARYRSSEVARRYLALFKQAVHDSRLSSDH